MFRREPFPVAPTPTPAEVRDLGEQAALLANQYGIDLDTPYPTATSWTHHLRFGDSSSGTAMDIGVTAKSSVRLSIRHTLDAENDFTRVEFITLHNKNIFGKRVSYLPWDYLVKYEWNDLGGKQQGFADSMPLRKDRIWNLLQVIQDRWAIRQIARAEGLDTKFTKERYDKMKQFLGSFDPDLIIADLKGND